MAAVGDPAESLASFSTYLDQVKTNAPADGPLANLLHTQDNIFKVAASLLGSNDPAEATMGASMMQGAREQVEAGITSEAKRLSNGDKDKEIALNYQLRGQAIPPDVVATALTNRVTKGQPLTGWLSSQNAILFQNTFAKARQQIALENPLMDKKDVENAAVEAGIQQVMTNASQGMTEQLLSFQMTMPDNPLKQAGLNPTEILSMYHDADSQGIQNYQQQTGLNDQEMQKRVTGETPDDQLAAAQAGAFYMSLEKKQPGLGQAYLNWWNSSSRGTLVNKYSEVVAANAGKNGFTNLAETSLVVPTLDDQMSHYATLLNQGQQNVYSTELARQHQSFVTFQGNAATKQAFLLQADKGLTDSDRKSAMSLIFAPLLKQVTESHMPADQAATFIESQLKTMKPDDAGTKAILKKVLAGRDGSLTILDDFAKTTGVNPMLIAPISPIGALFAKHVQPGNDIEKAMTGYQWFQDWKNSGQGY
jgi:hypothetical protein